MAFLLFVSLLWGPTALWLVYRSLRGPRGRLRETFTTVSEPMRSSQLAPDEPEALLGLDGYWVCETCRSLNHPEVNRCYGCRTAKGSAGRQAAGELPVTRGVPVMAEGSLGRQAAGELPVTRGVPVMAEGIARSSDEAAGMTVDPATPRDAPPAPAILVRAPEHAWSAAPPEAPAGVTVCPFLGFRDDPSTRYDFPDPANFCHATSERRAASVASPRRFVASMGGTRRPEPIGVEHQKSRCLTAAHEQCARHPAAKVVAANP